MLPPRAPLPYSTKLFPFAAIFEQLTQELQAKDIGPMGAYVRLQVLRRKRGLLSGADYCSTSITTGGHARASHLATKEIIAKNTLAGRQLVAELVQKSLLHPGSAILPVDMGNVPTWSQSDYIYFWLAVISGFDLGLRTNSKTAQKLHNDIMQQLTDDAIDLELMNNPGATPADRAPEYFKFARAFAQVTKHFQPEPHSAHRVINLIDTKDSLGCQTERLFAKLRGIPVYDIAITGPKSIAPSVFTNHALREDLQTIVRYGGTTVELLGHESFVLKHRDVLAEKR